MFSYWTNTPLYKVHHNEMINCKSLTAYVFVIC